MVPQDDFTPHGYLDNPYHSWKVNPSGVLRSVEPLGMGWHVPNVGSYVRNQFQYTAHLSIGLKVGDVVLVTGEEFKRHGCEVVSRVHTKNRFEYRCRVPQFGLTVTVRYFLVNEHVLGCVLGLATTAERAFPVTCYVMHRHTHNPHTSRLWEHGLYARRGPEEGTAVLGIVSEGDAFCHGARAADGGEVVFGEPRCVVSLEEVASWARGRAVAVPGVTQSQEGTGWQVRTVVVPCAVPLAQDGEARIVNVVLARGVSEDQARERWEEGIEEIARVEADLRADDEEFWSHAPQLAGDWPEHWRRGVCYDLETLRMVIRPSAGIIPHFWDGMQIQAPRTVIAEAAMDALFVSYGDTELAKEVLLGHFTAAPRANLPCMREDGSYNMVADDGQICGTAPEWGYPVWCCDEVWRRTGDRKWLRALYVGVARYLRWWLEERRDGEGWLVYACSWESGQDVSSRFGPQQTGGTIIEHVRPVDLQAAMMQGAEILVRWARVLGEEQGEGGEVDFGAEVAFWRGIADEFGAKTRQMWQSGWFRDFDAGVGEWSSQQDTMHLAAVFCGVTEREYVERLRGAFGQPPGHSGWAPLSWPPVVMTLVGAADRAGVRDEAAELAGQFIDAAYRSTDSRELDEQGGLPGVTREYHGTVTRGKWGKVEYVNAGIEGYGWGALSVDLLLRYVLGLRAEGPGEIRVVPCLPKGLRKVGASYEVGPISWGRYVLEVWCVVREGGRYGMHVRGWVPGVEGEGLEQVGQNVEVQEWDWEGAWGDVKVLRLEEDSDKKG